MRKLKPLSMLFIAVLFSAITLNSCDSIGANTEDELYGTWTVDEITVDVTANGKSLLDVMVDDFAISQDDAEAILDTIFMEVESDATFTVEFKDDLSYTVTHSDDDPENGTWTLSEDGTKLNIVNPEMESDILVISKLTSSTCIISLPTEDAEIDLNGDDEDETKIYLEIELKLIKQ